MSNPFILPVVAVVLGMTATSTTPALRQPDAEILVGKVRPTDGDSLRMGDKRIRLFGIDAVESSQKCDLNGEEWACGRASRKALERMVKGKTLSCEVRDMDRDRYVSVCAADGLNINGELVRRGWAVAYTRYSEDYAAHEAAARAERRGLWRSTFQRPHDWRASRRVKVWKAAEAQVPPNADCIIKGNISRSGTRIFHVPGQADYKRTSINVRSGERWFCSANEATKAGWRAAKR